MEEWIDKNVENVSRALKQRMEKGFKKYGTTTERKDLSLYDWIQHAQEEALDLAVYLERIKVELRSRLDDLK